MKCQILFSGKDRKIISKCHLLNFLRGVLSVNSAAHLSSCKLNKIHKNIPKIEWGDWVRQRCHVSYVTRASN